LTVRACLPDGTGGLDPTKYEIAGTEPRWSLGRLIGR